VSCGWASQPSQPRQSRQILTSSDCRPYTGLKVDTHRDGVRLTTTTNDGTYTDKVGKTGGPYTYKVCEAGTNTCSNEATINF